MSLDEFIDQINDHILDSKPHQTDLRLVLSTLKSLISQSNNGENPSRIQDALSYLEQMPFAPLQNKNLFFTAPGETPKTLGEDFAKAFVDLQELSLYSNAESKERIENDALHIPTKKFSEDEQLLLKILYMQLSLFYKLNLTPHETSSREETFGLNHIQQQLEYFYKLRELQKTRGDIKALDKDILDLLYKIYDKGSYNKKWDCDISINQTAPKEIIDSIKTWREELDKTPEYEDEINRNLNDFRRNVLIDSQKGKADEPDEQTKERILTFLKKSIYQDSPKDIEILAAWLARNGGQQMNMFMQYILKNHALNNSESTTPVMGNADINAYNWTLDKNGQIFLDFNMNINMLVFDVGDDKKFTLLANINKKSIDMFDPDVPEKFQAALQKYKESKTEKPPLLTVDTRIELQIQNGVVTPVFNRLRLASYTDLLTSPLSKKPALEETAKPSAKRSLSS